MRNLLFAALLGCFVASGLAQSTERFQFNDSKGNCWECSPSSPCQPCRAQQGVFALDDHPTTCPIPDCTILVNRAWLYPVYDDLTKFYQCAPSGATWAPVKVECQCSTFFSFENQRCEMPWVWQPFCDVLPNPITTPRACDEIIADTTTELITTTESVTTTPAPCQCIPWIPCWCNNPCMNMPCGNCNGCQG